MEELNDVIVKNEPICYSSQPISETREAKRQSILVKEEPIDSKIALEEFEVKTEEKFSATEEFANKASIQTTSIAFLNEETTKTAKRQSILVKEEPIDSEIKVKAEEFANKTSTQTASIAFLNEDKINSEPNKPKPNK